MKDTICKCGHWFEEHDEEGECFAPGCECVAFKYSESESTPEAIADRGGDPELWPERVKRAFNN